MKAIINRKKYDTSTADHLATYEASCSSNDFRWFIEKLYKKKTGEFFLYGKGGPMTEYSESVDSNSWTSGSKIKPLSIEEAKEWIENNSNDLYEDIFGEVEE